MANSDSPFRPYHLWLARILLLFAVGFTLYGCVGLWQARQLTHHGVHGQAVVTDYKVYPASGKSPTLYQPILRFVDPTGKTWEKHDAESRNERTYSIGQSVDVIYLPGHPGEFTINTWDDVWELGVVAVSCGAFTTLLFSGLLVLTSAALDQPALGAKWAWWDRIFLPLRIIIRLFN